jgi:hypothetical protein
VAELEVEVEVDVGLASRGRFDQTVLKESSGQVVPGLGSGGSE